MVAQRLRVEDVGCGSGWGLAGHRSAARQSPLVIGGDRLAADPPRAAGDVLDHAPGRGTHALAFDRDHRVGEALDDLLLLLRSEDTLEDLHLDERHAFLLDRTSS